VFSQHCKASRDVGLSEEQIQAIPAWSVATCFSPLERAVLAYTDCLVLEGGRVPDAVFDALRAHLSDEEILELSYITCTYEMHATLCRALRLEFDDVSDPITEVPGPGAGSLDVMSMVDRKPE
jgi:alkylhydroperoxidase family enzyme